MRPKLFSIPVIVCTIFTISSCFIDSEMTEAKTVFSEFLNALNEEDKAAAIQRAPALESLTNEQWITLLDALHNNPETRNVSYKIKKITQGEEYQAMIGEYSWIIRKLPSNNWTIDPAPTQTVKIDYIPVKKE